MDTTSNSSLLIDGSGFIYRAYYGMRDFYTKSGDPIGAVYGFCSMLIAILEFHEYSHCAIMLDKGRITFRSEIYAEYKANRKSTPEDLSSQFPIIREACEAFGICIVEQSGYEADDLIATYSTFLKKENHKVIIVSSDKDLMQLVDDRVSLYDPVKQKNITKREVNEKFGVNPEQIVDFLALVGDTSDNIPGVDGVGAKTAAKLLNTFGFIDGILCNIHSVKPTRIMDNIVNNLDRLHMARKLVQLNHDVDTQISVKMLECSSVKYDSLLFFFKKYEFNGLIKKVENILAKNMLNHRMI